MTNLLDGVKDMMTSAVLSKVSDVIGLDNNTTSSAVGKFLPAIIGGLISKGSTESGAAGLIDLFKKGGYGQNNISDLSGLLGNKEKTNSWLETGADLLGTIFGNRQSSVLDAVLGSTGIKSSVGSTLMKLLAPMVVNKLASMVFGNNWGASKLSSYLTGQKSSVPSSLYSTLGFSANDHKSVKSTGGNSWLKWLLPLLLLLGLLWFFTKDGCAKKEMVVDTPTTEMETNEVVVNETTHEDGTTVTEMAETNAHDISTYTVSANGDIVDGHGHIIFRGGTYDFDVNGNLVDDNGRILIAKSSLPSALMTSLKSTLGSYSGIKLTVDGSGNLVGPDGKVIMSKGSYVTKDGYYYDSKGTKLGRIWTKVVSAVAGTAEASLEAMKKLFTSMVKKESGAKSSYGLTNIEFNKENHRISNFSKAEVEGLAAALKANADGKIVVQAYTTDGKDEKENKSLSKIRAEVVHDMLVTLGVSDKQISFEGMGGGKGNRVDVVVK